MSESILGKDSSASLMIVSLSSYKESSHEEEEVEAMAALPLEDDNREKIERVCIILFIYSL